MELLSVITIRKGSKGLKDKCVQRIGDKMVFEYTLEYAQKLNRHIRSSLVVVSSDSEIVEEYCVERNIPFVKRSKELASDTAEIEDVVYDACNKINMDFKYISLLYGNLPTRYPPMFLEAYKFLEKKKDYDAVLSMQNVEKFNPSWMFDYNEEVLPAKKHERARRQDLQQKMIHDGNIILFRSKHFIKFMQSGKDKEKMYEYLGSKIKPFLNEQVVIDIDTKSDLQMARALLGGMICG